VVTSFHSHSKHRFCQYLADPCGLIALGPLRLKNKFLIREVLRLDQLKECRLLTLKLLGLFLIIVRMMVVRSDSYQEKGVWHLSTKRDVGRVSEDE